MDVRLAASRLLLLLGGVVTTLSVEPLSDGIGGDQVGYWTHGHHSRRKFIGGCLNAYKYDFGEDVKDLLNAKVKHGHWRESHDCMSCAADVENGDPPNADCHLCEGTGQMYDYMLLPANPEEEGSFAVTFVYFA